MTLAASEPWPQPLGPQQHLDAMITRVWVLLQRFVARYGYRMFGHGENFAEAFSGFAQAMAQIQQLGQPIPVEPWHNGHWPSPDALNTQLDQYDQLLKQLLEQACSSAEPPTLPLEELRARFHLNDQELMLLVAVAAPQLSTDLARAYEFVMADPSLVGPTCGFISELVAATPQDARALLYGLDANSTLVRQGLLEVVGQSTTASLHSAQVLVPRSVLRFICGVLGRLPDPLAPFGQLHEADTAPCRSELVLANGVPSTLGDALRRAPRRHSRLVLAGPRGLGKRSALRAWLRELGIGLLVIDFDALLAEHSAPLSALRQLTVEAALRGFAILLRCNHAVHSAPGSIVAEMRLVLDAFGGLVAASTTHQDARILTSLLGPAPIVELRPLNAAERRHLWQQALTTHLAPNQLAPLSDQLARRIRATPGAMVQGVRHASAQDSWTQAQQRADAIAAAVRSVNDHNLGELAEPTRTSLRWDEAVLAPETLARLEELVVHATHQGQVLDGWDMGRQLPYGRGLSCLFYGPPGTGKTMTAALVAQRLGLPLYRVELSKIVSKYIGETEKNLARLFDEAALAGGVLLFDEADSLFAKRTQVKGANDRYANLKVNYLLQRMEAYDGITILTTNLDKDLDEALRRRLRFRLYFPKPDLELRARLWATMLPPKALGTEPIDVEELAKKFDFAGGYIKNAILRAAFLAAQAGHPINTAMLNQAAVREARELGMLVRD